MIRQKALDAHLNDYADVFGETSGLFVCPITLRECLKSELINGHILNKALREACRRTVIQYGGVDTFYGTRVEPDLVRWLNQSSGSTTDLVRGSSNLEVVFADGTTASAFATDGKCSTAADKKFPSLAVQVDGEMMQVHVRVSPADKRAQGPVTVRGSTRFYRSHWVAAMLKAALLVTFDLFGYRAIQNPLGETLRSTLSRYYRDSGSREDAEKYFKDFRNSVNILGVGPRAADVMSEYRSANFDSLQDGILLIHCPEKDDRSAFAMTCLFHVNGTTVTTTIPQCMDGNDGVLAWKRYSAFLDEPGSVEHTVHRVQYAGGKLLREKRPMNIEF